MVNSRFSSNTGSNPPNGIGVAGQMNEDAEETVEIVVAFASDVFKDDDAVDGAVETVLPVERLLLALLFLRSSCSSSGNPLISGLHRTGNAAVSEAVKEEFDIAEEAADAAVAAIDEMGVV